MTAMPQERKEHVLVTVIGLSILLVVLVFGYLAYQTLPEANGEAGKTSLPATASAPPTTVDPSSSATTRSQSGSDAAPQSGPDDSEAQTSGGEPSAAVDRSKPGDADPAQPDKEG